jgi:hypothetical protein
LAHRLTSIARIDCGALLNADTLQVSKEIILRVYCDSCGLMVDLTEDQIQEAVVKVVLAKLR